MLGIDPCAPHEVGQQRAGRSVEMEDAVALIGRDIQVEDDDRGAGLRGKARQRCGRLDHAGGADGKKEIAVRRGSDGLLEG